MLIHFDAASAGRIAAEFVVGACPPGEFPLTMPGARAVVLARSGEGLEEVIEVRRFARMGKRVEVMIRTNVGYAEAEGSTFRGAAHAALAQLVSGLPDEFTSLEDVGTALAALAIRCGRAPVAIVML